MDIDVTLAIARQAARELADAIESDGLDSIPHHDETVDTLVEAFGVLDEWIKRGGFLPRDWQKGV